MNIKNFRNDKNSKVNYLLKNGNVINPDKKKVETSDILIVGKFIRKIGKNIDFDEQVEIIDCTGFCISPGIIDMRVSLGEPGAEHKETIKSASRSAACGGITSLVCTPNTVPPIDQPAIIQSIERKARTVALTKIFCTGCITRGSSGKELSELRLMKESGAVGFTDGNKSISSARVMRRALSYTKSFDGLIIQHAQEPSLSLDGDVNEGEICTRMGLSGIPNFAEPMIIQRDLWLVRDTNCRYHVNHISTKESIEIIRNAKREGLPVTCDTAPPYFILNELSLENYRTFSKLSPPLKTEEDRLEILNGIKDGTIDAIVSDHTPQDQDAKRLPFSQAEFGGIGLETLLPLCLSLVKNDHISLNELIPLITKNPARILNLDLGTLLEGKEADIIVFDPDKSWKVGANSFYSKSKNSPFDGMILEGKNIMTFVRGRLVYKLS
tara:strand:- start:513 stop:1829 length:1317 start_codon:yes stop_codon:yes gene_type:complete